jgi:hypothetical protein
MLKFPTREEALAEAKASWGLVPSQDNEGWVPDRGAWKAGFMAGYDWLKIKLQLQETTPEIHLDCGDNACAFKMNGPGGMRTNGGSCRCRPDKIKAYYEAKLARKDS